MKNPYFYTSVGVGGIELANDILNNSMPPETYYGRLYYIYKNWGKLGDNTKLMFNGE